MYYQTHLLNNYTKMILYNNFNVVIKSLGMQTLTHPLFYNSKVAIRFNIGDNGKEIYIGKNKRSFCVNPEYISVCFDRVKRIYNSLNNPPDILVIDVFLHENETIEPFVSDVISLTNLPQPKEIKSEPFYFDEDEVLDHVFLFWELSEFNPDNILREILLSDLGGKYDLASSVYFVCFADKVLFHLYDDRGADLCAEKTESIFHIYSDLNDLILEYDRERIDSIFKAE